MQKKFQIAAWILLISAALLIFFEGDFFLKDIMISMLLGTGAAAYITAIFWPAVPTNVEKKEVNKDHLFEEDH